MVSKTISKGFANFLEGLLFSGLEYNIFRPLFVNRENSMTEFDNKVDEIVQKTGAGTNIFRDNLNKRIQLGLKLTAINCVIFLLNFLAILYSLWPEKDVFKTLAGFIFLLSAASVVVGVMSIFVTWFTGYIYNKLAELNKRRNQS